MLSGFVVLAAVSLFDNLLEQEGSRPEEGIAHHLLFGEEELVVLVDLGEEVLGHEFIDLGKGHVYQFFFCFFIGHDAIALVDASKDVRVNEETVG